MFKRFLILLIIFIVGIALGSSKLNPSSNLSLIQTEKNTPASFISEVYDKVKENYWDNLSDTQLLDQFKQAFDKSGGSSYKAKFENKDQLITALNSVIRGMDEETKNKFTASVASSVLSSLSPVGRSNLYTQKNEEQLKNTVENVDPQKDLYKDLGIPKDASSAAIEQAYKNKSAELLNDSSPEAQEKLKQLTYAKDVLTQDDTKQRYDDKKVEPTIFTKIINTNILYFQFKKFSPTSYDEFGKAFESYKDQTQLQALIFDLRGNVGGAIDAAPYFLGHFIGKNQTAFDFYHKGDYLPFKTPTDKVPSITKFKQVVVLIDNNTQSSAEIMAATFKKYNKGVVVGVPSKGWGTVERVFPLDNQFDKSQKYSLFLVHSITLREDNQPIEGRGVEPDINIKNSNWEDQLFFYFRNPGLTQAIKTLL